MTVREAKGERPEIRDMLPQWELLAMVAEEASELAQAALKLRRCLDDVNPTRIGYVQAVHDLNEEWADVLLAIQQLSMIDDGLVRKIMKEKEQRWLEHLIRHRKEQEDAEGRL